MNDIKTARAVVIFVIYSVIYGYYYCHSLLNAVLTLVMFQGYLLDSP